MEIKIILEPIDRDDPLAIDPVGTITLKTEDSSFSEPYAYLDSWFQALMIGAEQLDKKPDVEVDLKEEREPLIFRKVERGVKICFKDKNVVVGNVAELVAAVEKASDELSKIQIFPKVYQKAREI